MPINPIRQRSSFSTSARQVSGRPARARCRLLIGVLVCFVLSASLAYAQDSSASEASTGGAVTQAPADYRISAGDVLALKFFYAPELNANITVRPDGKINLQFVGDFQAANLTPAQLASQLKAAYATTLRYPEVAVGIDKGFASQQIFVGGEVEHPGVQPLLPSLTLMRAVIIAQGFKETAASGRVLILRRDAHGDTQVIKVNASNQGSGSSDVKDPTLQPFDVVLVAPSGVAKLNKWVDQYIRRNIPVSVGFSYAINKTNSVN